MAESTSAVQLSVVIPTFNRLERLKRVLVALAAQTDRAAFEVVVVSDGSTDGTDEYLRSSAPPLEVIALSQENLGPAAARNRGVQEARGELVLFIDDDVIPEPELVARHLDTHRSRDHDIVVIGPMLTPDDIELSPWVAWEQHMLYKQYEWLNEHRDAYHRQFYTGNASVARRRVLDVGGFDTRFRRAEDVELAFRLDRAGLRFVFDPEARAFHYAERSFDSWLAVAYDYGRNDVVFAAEGAEWLLETTAIELDERNPMQRALIRTVVPRRRLARATSATLERVVRIAVRGPARVGRPMLSALYGLSYFRGMADALDSPARLKRILRNERSGSSQLRAVFVLEQTLGHVTHSANLRSLLSGEPGLHLTVLPIRPEVDGFARLIPGYTNWTIRSGVRARISLRRLTGLRRKPPADAMFIHSQVPAILTGRWTTKIPTVVSLDATPVQYDELGDYYSHDVSSPRVERWKWGANRRCFRRARHLVTWSHWALESLVNDYGIDRSAITVIPPGVDVETWSRSEPRRDDADHPVRVLFVGGDLRRKGGDLLIEAARRLRRDPSIPEFEVHLVTRSDVAEEPGLHVYRDFGPNDQALIDLYHQCDVFCLPTMGDCLPMVLSEAGAAEMALVSTDVGAIREIVRHGETGILVQPGDADALVDALRRLVSDPDERRHMGEAAAKLVRSRYDALRNAREIVDLLRDVARNGERA